MFWAAAIGPAEEQVQSWRRSVLNRIPNDTWTSVTVKLAAQQFGFIAGPSGTIGKSGDTGSSLICGTGFCFDGEKPILLSELTGIGRRDPAPLPPVLRQVIQEVGDGQFSAILRSEHGTHVVADAYTLTPAYYQVRGGQLFFASDIRALLLLEGVEIVPSSRIINSFLRMDAASDDNDDGHYTAYDGIYKLRPFERLFIPNGSREIQSLWVRLRDAGFESRWSLERSRIDVENRLNSIIGPLLDVDASPAVFDLSGGIDSATVVASALSTGAGAKVRTASMIFRNENVHFANDAGLIEEFRSTAGLEGEDIFSEDATEIASSFQPFLGPLTIASYGTLIETQRMAQRIGARFQFTGEGADFHYTGTILYFDYLLRASRFREAYSLMTKLLAASGRSILGLPALAASALPYLSARRYRKFFWPQPSNDERRLSLTLLTSSGIRAAKAYSPEGPVPPLAAFRRRVPSWYQQFHFDMLFPRPSYLDLLAHMPVQVVSPYLQSTLLTYPFRLPPEAFVDLDRYDFANDYAGTKRLIRALYPTIIPARISTKRVKSSYNEMALATLQSNAAKMKATFRQDGRFGLQSLNLVDMTRLDAVIDRLALLASFPSTTLGIDYLLVNRLWRLQEWLLYVSDPTVFRRTCFQTHEMV